MKDIPLIDLTAARLGGDEGERDVSRQLDRACREVGFFTLCGHGIARSVFEDVNAALGRFFWLPLSEKMKCKLATGPMMPADPHTPYGYSGLLEENAFAYTGERGKPNDYVEKFSAGRLILDDGEQLPFIDDEAGRDLRQKLRVYYVACQGLAARLTELFTLSLDLPRDFFVQRTDEPGDSLRAHRYPGLSAELANDQGMGEHYDGSLITLLTHTAPGIQIKTRGGEWITPQFREIDHFIVNIGNQMARRTDQKYVSTPHRVVLTSQERQSIVFFKIINDDLAELGYKQMDALFGRDQPGGSQAIVD